MEKKIYTNSTVHMQFSNEKMRVEHYNSTEIIREFWSLDFGSTAVFVTMEQLVEIRDTLTASIEADQDEYTMRRIEIYEGQE